MLRFTHLPTSCASSANASSHCRIRLAPVLAVQPATGAAAASKKSKPGAKKPPASAPVAPAPPAEDPQPSKPASQVTSANWSQRLVQVSKKRQKDGAQQQDVFDPRTAKKTVNSKGEGILFEGGDFDDDLDNDGEAGPSSKRLPAEMRCFDSARIFIKSGDGGNGCVAFRREKFVEFGGPSGANGGRGGNVWAVVDPNANSLFKFRGQVHWRAEAGVNGQGKQLDGANATDLEIPVPAGTIIRRKDAKEGEPPLAELVRPGDRALLLVGGRGGRGNLSFKTATNTAPTMAERGEAGGEAWVDLELKVVADVGIIGIPNAGKSTLLSVLTAAKPKIANYPFTTLVPNLGVCELDYRTTVFADVPGLLEGAHEGLGLGHEFLRHVQRCRALVHVLDGTSPDPMGDFRAINLELELFNPDLKHKPQIVAYNKVDLPDSGDFWDVVREELLADGIPPERIFPVSAATGRGVTELVRAVRRMLDEMGPPEDVYETDALNLAKAPPRRVARMDEFEVEVEEQPGGSRAFFVEGEAIQKFAQMTNWNYYESVKRFQSVLEASGINAALRAKGIREGDSVVIADSEFEWQDDQSQGALYEAYVQDMRARGQTLQGGSHWPRSSPTREDKKDKKWTP